MQEKRGNKEMHPGIRHKHRISIDISTKPEAEAKQKIVEKKMLSSGEP
jgi:hypothetical protein